ncbi:MAG TPA: hypothetical protein PK766_06485 [Bacteroidales bacterium]|nr:hypothetical protein [Bacteroidales bacterium]
MQRFLIRTILFSLLAAGFFTGMIIGSELLISARKKELLTLNEGILNLFAGNSSVECAVDDRLVKHTVNIAESGEAYLYSFVKIKALLEENKHLETVFLGYSFADLLLEKEESWLFSDEYIVEKVKDYNYLLEPEERKLLLANNPKAYLNGLLKSVFSNLTTALGSNTVPKSAGQLVNFGGYKFLVRDKLNADPGFKTANDSIVKSHQQEKYLKKIYDLCQRHQVRLVLFTTPKHSSYIESLEADNFNMWIDVRNDLHADSLLDLSRYVLPDSCFGDLSHLNYRGAKLFSAYLDTLLNK